jgi:hypothetical protein
MPAGYVPVPTTSSAAVTYGATTTVNLPVFPTAYAGDHYTLEANGSVDQIVLDGTVTDSIARSALTTLSFSLTGSGASLTVNGANGNPLPSGGIAVTGVAGQSDSLAVVGTSGPDTLAVTSTAVTFSSIPINYANITSVSVDPGGGTDALAVNSGTVTVPAPAAGSGILARQFSSLSVASGASLAFATAAAHSDRQVIVVPAAPTVAGTLDLGGNDMIVRSGSLTVVTALAKAGFANGEWTGNGGLASSAAGADATHLTALGVISNARADGTAIYATFDGVAVTAADVLVKYTFSGDANLDGTVDAADYTRIDAGFIAAAAGWANGDFNYDGVIDGSDFTLIDSAYNGQTTTL